LTPIRCSWPGHDPVYLHYHDHEWGVPQHDDYKLFEALILDGFQAGLSWITILKRRENFRLAFDAFDFEKVALYDEKKQNELLLNEGIIRNRLKIKGATQNALAFIKVRAEFGSFDQYIWAFVNHTPIQNHIRNLKDLPAKTELSDLISKDLKKRGFAFVGSTIIYAFMQAIGMVNDHFCDCFRYDELGGTPSK